MKAMKDAEVPFWKKSAVEVAVMFLATFLWIVAMIWVLGFPVSSMDVLLFSAMCGFFLSPLSGRIMKVPVFRWMGMEASSWPARIVFFVYEGVVRTFLFFLIVSVALWHV
jgi:hypothetical protein